MNPSESADKNQQNLPAEQTNPGLPALERRPSAETAPGSDVLWNALSLLLLVGTLAVLAYVGMVFVNPFASYNPFPPPVLPEILVLPTLQPSRTPIPASATVPPTLPPPSVTPVLSPTPTQPPTPTAILATPLGTLGSQPTATPTQPASAFPFVLQGPPSGVEAALFDPSHACSWSGVGGRVTDLKGSPATRLEVQLFGILDGKMINETSLTGTNRNYGEAGYEFTLAAKPVASTQRLWVRLVDQAGVPLSDRVFIDTFSDCKKNLILVNFKQVK